MFKEGRLAGFYFESPTARRRRETWGGFGLPFFAKWGPRCHTRAPRWSARLKAPKQPRD
jgi:hypothetical protein